MIHISISVILLLISSSSQLTAVHGITAYEIEVFNYFQHLKVIKLSCEFEGRVIAEAEIKYGDHSEPKKIMSTASNVTIICSLPSEKRQGHGKTLSFIAFNSSDIPIRVFHPRYPKHVGKFIWALDESGASLFNLGDNSLELLQPWD